MLYYTAPACPEEVLKRLFVVSSEIKFMHRPSIKFGDHGTVGHESFLSRFDWSDSPVPVSFATPPSGYEGSLHFPAALSEMQNPSFINCFWRAFSSDDSFARLFVHPDSNYVHNTGSEIIDAIRQDKLLAVEIDYPNINLIPQRLMAITTHTERKATFRLLLEEMSIRITNTQLVLAKSEFSPLTEYPDYSELFSLRGTNIHYRQSLRKSPLLAMVVAECVIPDELLKKLTIEQIFEYRHKAKDAYIEWDEQIENLSSDLDKVNTLDDLSQIQELIKTKVKPQLKDYHRNMEAVRDSLFAELLKNVSRYQIPSIILASLMRGSFADAIVAFAASLVPITAPPLIDYIKGKRQVVRNNSMSYLLQLTNKVC